MTAAILIRTGSFTAHSQHEVIGSPTTGAGSCSLRRCRSFTAHSQHEVIGSPTAGAGSCSLRRCRSTKLVQRPSMHLEIHPEPLRRARSATDLMGSCLAVRTSAASRWSPPARLAEEEVEYSSGGIGKGRNNGGGGGNGSEPNENGRIGDYYKEMLTADPSNPLLLRNYGRFLHVMEGDVKKAEEYYGRAILASPGDGEVLSLYGKLVWEAHRDGDRAGAYFERAVQAAPDDCYVLGSYAKFLWDTEEEEEGSVEAASSPPPPLVQSF